MTYQEKILYLTGNFIQLSQYALDSACRVIALYEAKQEETPYTKGSLGTFTVAENKAKEMRKSFVSLSATEILEKLSGRGIPVKDFKALTSVLKKRDYVVSSFYLDNEKAIATEEIAVYVSKINELEGYCDEAKKVDQTLAALSDKLYL